MTGPLGTGAVNTGWHNKLPRRHGSTVFVTESKRHVLHNSAAGWPLFRQSDVSGRLTPSAAVSKANPRGIDVGGPDAAAPGSAPVSPCAHQAASTGLSPPAKTALTFTLSPQLAVGRRALRLPAATAAARLRGGLAAPLRRLRRRPALPGMCRSAYEQATG